LFGDQPTIEGIDAADLLSAAIQQSVASRYDRSRDLEALRCRWQFDLNNAPGPAIRDVICRRFFANGQSHLLRHPALRRFLFEAPASEAGTPWLLTNRRYLLSPCCRCREPLPGPPANSSGLDLIESLEALKPLVALLGSDKVKRLVDLLG
jgi:hypothetical protein